MLDRKGEQILRTRVTFGGQIGGGHVKGSELIEAPGEGPNVRRDRLPVKASFPVPGKGLDGRIGGHGATPIAPEQAPPDQGRDLGRRQEGGGGGGGLDGVNRLG